MHLSPDPDFERDSVLGYLRDRRRRGVVVVYR